jgi:hypothetical protein
VHQLDCEEHIDAATAANTLSPKIAHRSLTPQIITTAEHSCHYTATADHSHHIQATVLTPPPDRTANSVAATKPELRSSPPQITAANTPPPKIARRSPLPQIITTADHSCQYTAAERSPPPQIAAQLC